MAPFTPLPPGEGSEVTLRARETADSSVLRSSSIPPDPTPKRSPSTANVPTPSSLPSLQAPSSPSAFLSLERALRRSVRALRRSLLGHNSSASSPLGYFFPSAAR